MTTIALASDHAGFKLKEAIKSYLADKGYNLRDFGPVNDESCDYPDFGHPAANDVETGDADLAITMCGTGNGMQMTLNKHQKIRAALCWLPEIAALARKHNDANILVLPARFISESEAIKIVDAFIETDFEGGRHLRRIKKIPLNIDVEGEIM